MDLLVRPVAQVLRERLEPKSELRNGMAVGIVIIHTQPAAEIDVVHPQPLALEIGNDAVGTDAFVRENVLHIRDLRSDMEMQALEIQVFAIFDQGNDRIHVFFRNAELVHFQASGDEAVRMGIDIGIDPDGYIRLQAHFGAQALQGLEFLDGLAVERADAGLQRIREFLVGFADSGKDNLFRGEAMVQGVEDLVPADTVGA